LQGQIDLSGVSKNTTVQVLEVPAKQCYLTVTSAYDSASTSSGWFDSGTNITESVTSPVSGGNGIQYVCTGWNGTGSVPASGAASAVTFAITTNSTITWNWKTQYYLSVDSAYGTLGGAGWHDSGSTAYAALLSGTLSGGSGIQYVFTGWSGDASGSALTSNAITMNAAKTARANWKTQFQVTFGESGVGSDFTGTVVAVDSANYSVGGLPVSFWWDSGSSHSFSFASPLIVNATKHYGWSSTSGLSALQSGTLTVTASGSVVGNYDSARATASPHSMPPSFPPWLVLASTAGLGLLGACVLFMFLEMDLTINSRKRNKGALANKSS
jgi:uncharacterized repeat protein (TIGR02543 family)